MLPRWLFWPLFAGLMGLIVGASFVSSLQLPLSQPICQTNATKTADDEHACDTVLTRFWNWTTHDAVAFYTSVLALFTGILGGSTIGLWMVTSRGIKIQSQDTRILQRAYLHVLPRGIDVTQQGTVLGQIAIHNAGHLPARKVSNVAKIMWSEHRSLSEFEETKISIQHPNVLPAGGEMPRGTGSLNGGRTVLKTARGFIYVWGRVTYEDGFGEARWLTFCHRYNCAAPKGADGGIEPRYARQHHYYNDGN